jgi:hypothetical protein
MDPAKASVMLHFRKETELRLLPRRCLLLRQLQAAANSAYLSR